MTEYDHVRSVFCRAMERSLETFFHSIANSLVAYQELIRGSSLPKEPIACNPSPLPKDESMTSSESEESLQPTDIERHKAQQILEKMGWKIPQTPTDRN